MNNPESQSFRPCPGLGLTAFLCLLLGATCALANNSRQNPTSKLFVADLEGVASINTGEKIEDLSKKSVHRAEGTILETQADSTNALVLSNGTGIFLDSDTRLEIRRFLQEPFQPNRTDLETEPSMSQTQTYLPRGTVGLCTSRLVAGSSMVYNTPLASVNIRGEKVVIEVNDDETIVSLLLGDVTIRGQGFAGGEVLRPGQQAVIRQGNLNDPPTILIRTIPDTQAAALDAKVSMACMARRTVYFDIGEGDSPFIENDDPSDTLIPIEVTPTNPNDIGPILTPARITQLTPGL